MRDNSSVSKQVRAAAGNLIISYSDAHNPVPLWPFGDSGGGQIFRGGSIGARGHDPLCEKSVPPSSTPQWPQVRLLIQTYCQNLT